MSAIALCVENLSKMYHIGRPSTLLRTGAQQRHDTTSAEFIPSKVEGLSAGLRDALVDALSLPRILRLRSGQVTQILQRKNPRNSCNLP